MRESITIIVPDETDSFKDYHRALDSSCSRHGLAIFEFCQKNNISFSLSNGQVKEDNYNGYIWSRMMAHLGYVTIQETFTHKVFYLPPQITLHQYAWLKRYKSYFKRYREIICFYSYTNITGGLEETLYDDTTILGSDCFTLLYDSIKEKHERSKCLSKTL